jgi:hypothetical protein
MAKSLLRLKDSSRAPGMPAASYPVEMVGPPLHLFQFDAYGVFGTR